MASSRTCRTLTGRMHMDLDGLALALALATQLMVGGERRWKERLSHRQCHLLTWAVPEFRVFGALAWKRDLSTTHSALSQKILTRCRCSRTKDECPETCPK